MNIKRANNGIPIRPSFWLWGVLLYAFYLTSFAGVDPQTKTISDNLNIEANASLVDNVVRQKVTLPVENNRFLVDDSVHDIEVVLTSNDMNSLFLLSPKGESIMPNGSKDISWQQIGNLYGVKIPNPVPGLWEIKGKLLAPPVVVIVSDLEMVTKEFPNNLFRGENLELSVYLKDKGQKVTDKDILSHTLVSVVLNNVATSEIYKMFLKEDSSPDFLQHLGTFSYDYRLNTLPGVYRIIVQAKGLLFQREHQQEFYLYDYPAKIGSQIFADTNEIALTADLSSPILDPATCQFMATFKSGDGVLESFMLDKKQDNNWKIVLPVTENADKLNFSLTGKTRDQRLVHLTFPEVDVATLYQQAHAQLAQYLQDKQNKLWQDIQDWTLSSILPFSKEQQIDDWSTMLFAASFEIYKPLHKYSTYFQNLLKLWKNIVFNLDDDFIIHHVKPVPKNTPVQNNVNQIEIKKPIPPPPPPKANWLVRILVSISVLLILSIASVVTWLFWGEKLRSRLQNFKLGKQTTDQPQPALTQESPAVKEAPLLEEKKEEKPKEKTEPKPEDKPVLPLAEKQDIKQEEVIAKTENVVESSPDIKVEEQPEAKATPEPTVDALIPPERKEESRPDQTPS